MKKTGFILLSVLLLICSNRVFAESVNIETKEESIKSIPGSIIINGMENNLYPEYDDPNKELELIQTKYDYFIELLSCISGYQQITETNYYVFLDAYYQLLDSRDKPDWLYEGCTESKAFLGFIDIYENTAKNAEIMSIYNSPMNMNEKIQILSLLLPEGNPLSLSVASTNSYTLSQLGFNRSTGITYASTYYFYPNTAYHVYSSDCTNFVSQILHEGGVPLTVNSSESFGWWYKMSPDSASVSWRLADYFCKRFGMYYTSTLHYNFANNIQAGSFIAFDEENDGDWDHVAFVTDIGSYSSSLGYRDYEVAQHTTNYKAWTSTWANHWDTIQDGTLKYGVIMK